MLMCKICIARRLVVDIFPWCNANFVPFPSGTLVARRMGNGSIKGKVYKIMMLLSLLSVTLFIYLFIFFKSGFDFWRAQMQSEIYANFLNI